MKKAFTPTCGFTLVEILVVISIISILTAVTITSMSSAKASSNDKVRVSDLAQIQLALKLYQTQNNGYPIAVESVAVSSLAGINTYGTIPTDPKEDGGTYRYMYDSDYNCTAAGQTVIYAENMETTASNEDVLCGTTGGTKYVVVIQ